MLVLPERHVPRVAHLEPSEVTELFLLVRDLSRAVVDAFAPDGLHVWSGSGGLAGQSMRHMHVQIVPRYRNRAYTFAPSSELPITPFAERRRQAQLIRSHLDFEYTSANTRT